MRGAVEALNAGLRWLPVWPFYVVGFVPAGTYLWLALETRLGADPLKVLEHELGLIALQLLIATLAVTPLREQTRINLLRFRRMLGLMAFYYVAMHFSVWLLLDRQLAWGEIVADLTKRPYVILGFTGLLLLIPLALTSWDGAVRRLGGAAWRRLHKLIYPAAALGAVHFVWLVKAWPLEPLVYAAIVLALLGYRALPARMRRPRRVVMG
jgi:sulfoxide reductase heme-binding subunit YedZ